MADSPLNITVNVSNIVTLDDARKALKELNKELGRTALENIPRQKELGVEIVKVKNIIADATAGTVTANGKMMRSYFTLGEQLRQFYYQQRVGNRTMMEVTQTFGQFGSMLGMGGIGGVVGSAAQGFQQMEFAVTAAGLAAQRGTGIIATLGSKLMEFAMPLAGAAAGFALLMMAIKAVHEITEKLNKSIEKNTELLVASGRITRDQYIEMLQLQIKKVEQEEISVSFWASLLGKTAMVDDYLTKIIDKGNKILQLETLRKAEVEKAVKLDWDRFLAEVAILDKEDKSLEVQKAKTAELIKHTNELFKQLQLTTETGEVVKGRTFIGRRAISEAVPFMGETITGERAGIVGGGKLATGRKAVEAMRGEMEQVNWLGKDFTDSLSRGMENATGVLAEGFMRTFKMGEGLIARFGAALLAAIVQALSVKAAAGIMDWLKLGTAIVAAPATGGTSLIAGGVSLAQYGGLIKEPTLGFGLRTGRKILMGEAGPEQISPINQIGQAGRYGGGMVTMPPLSLRTEISGSNLAIIVESGNRQNYKRRIR